MKKSIKYAGIAAATLLTVAPIAAPVVSNVTTVQAAGEEGSDGPDTTTGTDDNKGEEVAADDPQTSASKLQTALDNFDKNFDDIDAKDLAAALADSSLKLGSSNKYDADTFKTTAAALGKDGAINIDALLTNSTEETDANIRDLYVTTNSSDVSNLTDLVNVLKDSNKPEVKITVHYTYNNTNGDAKDGSKTFTATRSDEDDITKINVGFTTPMTVALNSRVTDTILASNAKVSVTDQNGDGVLTTSQTPEQNYYYTYKDAITDGTAIATGSDELSDDAIPEFKKAGTYYQAITVKASSDSDLAAFITKYDTDPAGNPIYVNGKVASAGYDFSINTAGDTLTFVRTIKVSSDSSTWTVEDVDGQVTTKNDASYYTLKNNDNATITNRALQANTAWKTDKVRTDQNGNKQYRVATGEWVNADDVTFTKAGDVDTSTGALTDIQKVTGTASLDGGNYVYFLYGKDGKVLTQRSLMPGTDWKVINTAKDAEGNTYYRVATNEWLQQGTGVHFN